MNPKALRSISVLLFMALLSIGVLAQTETGQITGTIRDASGAVLAGAKVTVKSVTTGLTRDAVTNSSGNYTIPSLKPDTYDITVDMNGFQKFSKRVQVAVSSNNDVSAQLSVTGGNTTVEVTGSNEAAQVNTETQTLSQVVTSKDLAELPTLTRNPYDLVATAGNVNEDTNSDRGAGYSINGQRSASTDILLDGGENVDTFSATVGQPVPLDSVQEFSVLTNNFTAEYGRASGGVVNVVTKSGTNAFHGSAYEFNRISDLAANTYQNDATSTPKGIFTRNQFGFSLGGPVIKNKLFFFENAEWIRVRSSSPVQYDVLDPGAAGVGATAADVQAFFHSYGTLAPNVHTIGTTACGTFLCDQVSFNVPTDAGGGLPQNTFENVARVDYNFTDKTTMFGRYALYKEDDFAGTINNSPYSGYNTGNNTYDQNATINLTHIFTPSLVNTVKFIYNRLNELEPLGTAPVSPTLYQATSLQTYGGLPLVFPGYSETSPGSALPFGGPQNLYQIYDDISWTKGKHEFKFGGDYINIRDNRDFGAYEEAVETLGSNGASGLANLASGSLYEFESAINPQGKFPCPGASTGTPTVTPGCTVTLPVGEPDFGRTNRYNDGAAYAQDSWKILPRFTLNYGVRWEYFGVQHNSDPALDSNFYFGSGATIFDQIRNGSVQLADQSPIGGLWAPQKHNFAPRLGFAWDVFGDGSTAIRGGYGISYDRDFGNVTFNVIQNPPNYAVIQLFNTSTGGPLPVYTSNTGPLTGTGSVPLPATSLRAVNPNLKTAYSEFWDLAVERQLARNTVLSLDYAGSRGIHLYDISNINPPVGGSNYLGDTTPDRLNYQYANINFRSDNGFSIYNALNVKYSTTNLFNRGLNLNANYTWSHSLDNLSSTFSEIYGGISGDYYLGYLDAFNPRLDYGNSDFDVRHRFVLSGTWDIPWMKNAGNGFAREALGGWGLGSFIRIRSGAPFSIFDCSNFASNGVSCPLYVPPATVATTGSNMGAVQANVFNYLGLPTNAGGIVGVGNALGIPTCTGLYHTGCTYTADGQPYPDRNGYLGPGYWNMDMNFYKTFKLSERFNLQFRGELYNIFNHHNLYILSQNLDVSSMSTPYVEAEKGGIYGYAGQPNDERRNVQFALKLTF